MGLISDIIRELAGEEKTVEYRQYSSGADISPPRFEPDLDDIDHIHNLRGYYKLANKNRKRFKELNKRLRRRYGVCFHEETLKEIALDQLFTKYQLQDIEQLIIKCEQIPTIDQGVDDL